MVVDGLPLHGQVQLAVDTTLVSSVRGSGEPRQGAATTDGVALTQARRRKEKTFPGVDGPGARARLVVLALEVGGRWSAEAKSFCGSAARDGRKPCQEGAHIVSSNSNIGCGAGSWCVLEDPAGCQT